MAGDRSSGPPEGEEERLASEAMRRSRERRRLAAEERRRRGRRRLGAIGASVTALTGAALLVVALDGDSPDAEPPPVRPGLAPVPPAPAPAPAPAPSEKPVATGRPSLAQVWRTAGRRPGYVSVAIVSGPGRVFALRGGRRFVSASVVKAVMLVALLRELEADGESLDSGTAATLEEMITYSDNDAADEIYYRLGDAPIEAAARAAGARTLDTRGYWSETYLSARDAARFMWSLERLLPRRHRALALRLLRSIVSYQRWGIPEATPRGWSVAFKGGWRGTDRGQLVHQMALLRCGPTRLAIAVMTDGMPSMAEGTETVEGVTRRALAFTGA